MSTDSGLPPGCRATDVWRGESRLNDLSPRRLWMLLSERQKANLYRCFFRQEWAELSVLTDEQGMQIKFRSRWLAWRDAAVCRMAMKGEIQISNGKESTW
jgi:hypothetical protein